MGPYQEDGCLDAISMALVQVGKVDHVVPANCPWSRRKARR